MPDSPLNILILENDTDEAHALIHELRGKSPGWMQPCLAGRVSEAVSLLSGQSFDVILMNILLPDSNNFDGFQKVHEAAPKTPIVMMTDVHSTLLSVKAVQRGAQDYLVKGQVKGDALKRLVINAVERHRGMTQWEEEQRQRQLQLERSASTDEMTGLLNRRTFRERTVQEMFRSGRSGSPLCLLLFSVDRFSGLEQEYGEEDLQSMSASVAGILKHKLRLSDLAGYYAENEYAILLPDTPHEGADILANRIRVRIARQQFLTGKGKEFHITCSVGIAVCSESVSDSVVFVKRARDARDAAQAKGGDCVIISGGP